MRGPTVIKLKCNGALINKHSETRNGNWTDPLDVIPQIGSRLEYMTFNTGHKEGRGVLTEYTVTGIIFYTEETSTNTFRKVCTVELEELAPKEEILLPAYPLLVLLNKRDELHSLSRYPAEGSDELLDSVNDVIMWLQYERDKVDIDEPYSEKARYVPGRALTLLEGHREELSIQLRHLSNQKLASLDNHINELVFNINSINSVLIHSKNTGIKP